MRGFGLRSSSGIGISLGSSSSGSSTGTGSNSGSGSSGAGAALCACPLVPMEPRQVDSPGFRESSRRSSEWAAAMAARVRALAKQLARLREAECAAALGRKQLLAGLDEVAFGLLRDGSSGSSSTDSSGAPGGSGARLAGGVSELTSGLADLESVRISATDTLALKLNVHLLDFVQGPVQEALDAHRAYQKSCAQLDALLARTARGPRAARTAAADADIERACAAHRAAAVAAGTRLNAVAQRLPVELACAVWAFAEEERRLAADVAARFVRLAPVMHDVEERSARRTAAISEQAKETGDPAQHSCSSGASEGSSDEGDTRTAIEGYLFKQSSSIRKDWHRRYFAVRNGEIRLYKAAPALHTSTTSTSTSASAGAGAGTGATGTRTRTDAAAAAAGAGAMVPKAAFDIMLTTVRPREDLDRGYCFELVSPKRRFLLQAETAAQYAQWLAVINNAREECLRQASPASQAAAAAGPDPAHADKEDSSPMLQVLWDLDPDNQCCCDCGAPHPDWVAINLGLLCCINCSGIHRSLGVSFSKVRSVKLDSIDPEVFLLIARLGNRRVNKVYEACVPECTRKPAADAPHDERTAWIRAKYVERRFVSTDVDAGSCTALFYEACRNDSLLSMLFYFAHGADINTRFPPDNEFVSLVSSLATFPPSSLCSPTGLSCFQGLVCTTP